MDIAAIEISREKITSIRSREEYMKLFVETWEISDASNGDIYPSFGWADNDAVKSGVANHIIKSIKQYCHEASPRILDLGCGDGFTTVKLSEQFDKQNLTAVDPSPSVEVLTKIAGIPAIRGTLDTIDFADDEFDVVVIVGNLMLHQDPFFTLSEAYRILKPDGIIVFDYKNIKSAARRLASVLCRYGGATFYQSPTVQRNFLNMRFGLNKKVVADGLSRIGFNTLRIYSKPPRLLEFKNSSNHQSGLRGALWRGLNSLDGVLDERAWIQVVARKG